MTQVRVIYDDGSSESYPSGDDWSTIREEAENAARSRGTSVKNIGLIGKNRCLGVMGLSRSNLR